MDIRTASLVLALGCATLAHAVDDAAFERCRGIRDAPARLACYDGLPMGAPQAAPQPPPIAPARAPSAAPSAPAAAQTFGLEQRAPAVEPPATMESRIPGHFGGWGPRARITLANGTVWQIVDDSSAFMNVDNPKVSVRRGMMGGFFLDFENDNRSPRVRRVQ